MHCFASLRVTAAVWISALALAPALAAAPCPDLPAADAAGLVLATALDRVADCHPDVRAARSAWAGAAADVQVAGQLPNPQLTLGAGSVGSPLGSGTLWSKTFDHSVRVDQLIERGNKPALRRAAAQAALDAAWADLAEARRRAMAAVAQVHQDLWAAQSRRAQLQGEVALSDQSLRLLDQRVRAGDAPALDAARFRLDDARLRAELRQSDADGQDLQRQLASLIGAGAAANLLQARPADLFAVPALADAAAQADALERRGDVVAALARVRAAESLRGVAAAGRIRDVTVGVQLDHWPTSPANASGTGNTLSLSVSVPLFVRHANDGELARADADLSTAREAMARVRRSARDDLERALAQVQAATERRRLVLEQLEPAAGLVSAGAELAYRRGASSALDVLDARRNLHAVRIERIAADAELAKALAAWRMASLPVEALP